ncbi:MAG: hypothetical protein N2746_05755 [Deltaproteobacteria bacterium]|nr:hypothetical protein [Deltaproteobacteria bacterium]
MLIVYFDEVRKDIGSEQDVGLATSIAIDSNGKVHISYYNYSGQDLMYLSVCI